AERVRRWVAVIRRSCRPGRWGGRGPCALDGLNVVRVPARAERLSDAGYVAWIAFLDTRTGQGVPTRSPVRSHPKPGRASLPETTSSSRICSLAALRLSSQSFSLCCSRRRLQPQFELDRAHIADCRVQSTDIVECIDVFADPRVRFGARLKVALVEHLALPIPRRGHRQTRKPGGP